ncbi:MAG TPA: oligosaccharide flippase family protein, partial [Candidatus Saccharimonadales bacterium]|nr:oligosaccharide flippase family protein [Candidatus Saccharimonadales bacterium]
GTLVNVAIGGLFFLFAPIILGPESYGLFAVVMATGLMAVNFANFGIDSGILRFLKPNEEKQNNQILKLAFKAYVIIGLSIFVLGFILAGPLAKLLSIENYAGLLRIAFSGVIFILITNFFTAVLQTRKKFIESSLVGISSNLARLLILLIASYFATISLFSITVLFFFVTIISTIVGGLYVPLDFLKEKDEHTHAKNFFGYNFWIAASLAISSIPIDNYILVKLSGPLATGIFAAPMKLLSTTYQFAGSFSRVLASRYSSFDTKTKAMEFSKKSLPFVILISFGLITAGILFGPIVKIILGKSFASSVPVFRILSVGMAFFFAETIPMAILLYYMAKPKVTFYITIIHYVIYAALLFHLIPKFNVVGASWAFTISEGITFIVLSGYVYTKLQKND